MIKEYINRGMAWLGYTPIGSKEQAQLTARKMSGNQALTFYEGDAPKQLKVESGKPDDNIYINYAATIVDRGVDFLFGDDLKIEIGAEGEDRTDTYLERVWSSEQRCEDLIDLATDGGIFGDGWLKISIDSGMPQVTIPDPLNMSVVTDKRNYRKVLMFRCQYETENDGKKVLYKEETSLEGTRWVIREYESINEGRSWYQIGTDVFWNYSFPPYFHAKNLTKSKSYYGRADLTKSVIDLCKYISRLDSLLGKTVRVHSTPKPWAKGLTKQDLQISTEGILFLGQSADAAIGLLEMTGDLASAIEVRKIFREGLAEVSKVPEVATGKVENVGQLSGFALQILYGPLIKQTKKKQVLYGRALTECVKALMTIGGFGEQEVQLHWSEPVPTNMKEEAETGILLKQNGVSEDTIQRRLGFDPDEEREKRKLEVEDVGNKLLKAFDAGEGDEAYS